MLKLKILNNILIIDILTIILILILMFVPFSIARILIGIPFLLFFPGYTFIAAVYPNKSASTRIERIALSMGLSLAISALIGFGINYSMWGIRLDAVLLSITGFILLMSLIALIRQSRERNPSKFWQTIDLSFIHWDANKFNKSIGIVTIIAIFAALGTLVYTTLVPNTEEKFSEFYILGVNRMAQAYPTNLIFQENQTSSVSNDTEAINGDDIVGRLTLGIANHEQQTISYAVTMKIDGQPGNIIFNGKNINKIENISLLPDEKWENEIGFTPQHYGMNQKVEFFLYKDNSDTSEESVSLWINVQSTP